MARLDARARGELSALKRLCYGGLDSRELRRRVTERLVRFLGLDAFCFPAADPATTLPVDIVHEGRPRAAFEAFLDRVFLRSVVSDIGRCARLPRRVLLVEEILHLSGRERDPYVEVMLRPYGLRHEVHLSLARRGTAWGHLCLARRRHAFGRDELELSACLVPHLRAGLRAAGLRAAMSAGPGAGVGVVVLDAEDRIELASAVAERVLGRAGRSPLTGLRWVARLLARTLAADGNGDVVTVPFLVFADAPGREAYRLSAERIPGADGRPRTLVLVEPARPTERADGLVTLGLTGR